MLAGNGAVERILKKKEKLPNLEAGLALRLLTTSHIKSAFPSSSRPSLIHRIFLRNNYHHQTLSSHFNSNLYCCHILSSLILERKTLSYHHEQNPLPVSLDLLHSNPLVIEYPIHGSFPCLPR